MNQKTKVSILIALVLLIVAGVGAYLFQKNKATIQTSQVTNLPQIVEQSAVLENTAVQVQPQEKKESIVGGKFRSVNEKQIFIELADGKGSAINIAPSTPVKNEGDDKVGNLSILKIGAIVSVKVDENNNAIEILIKK